MGYGLRYEYGIFRQEIKNGYQVESPDNWLRRPDPWEVVRPGETVEARINCTLRVRRRRARAWPAAMPATLQGIPYDRPVVGYGGKTINTLRLWEAAAPDYFDFGEFNHGDFFGAVHDKVMAENLTRVLYPDDSTSAGRHLRFLQEYFLVACSLADIVRRFRRAQQRLARPARQGRHPAQRHAPVAGRRRADAHPARRGRPGLGRGLGPDRADARLHQPHAAARGPGEMAGRAVRAAAAAASGNHLRDQPPLPRRRPRALSRRRGPACSA